MMVLGLGFFFSPLISRCPPQPDFFTAPYPHPVNNPMQAIADRVKSIICMRLKINFPMYQLNGIVIS